MLNEANMIKAIEILERTPDQRFEMNNWGLVLGDIGKKPISPLDEACGTIACIAGTITMNEMDGWKVDPATGYIRNKAGDDIDDVASDFAADFLGLNRLTKGHLFMPDHWLSTWFNGIYQFKHELPEPMGDNMMPSSEAAERMQQFAIDMEGHSRSIYHQVKKPHAIEAMRGLLNHPGYVDWEEAIRKAAARAAERERLVTA